MIPPGQKSGQEGYVVGALGQQTVQQNRISQQIDREGEKLLAVFLLCGLHL